MLKRIAVLLIVLNFISCKEIIKEALDASSSKKTEKLDSNDFKEIIVDSLYKLSVPKYMKEIKNLHEEASLKYGHLYKETYTIVIHENKNEFIESFKKYDEYNIEKSVVENYSEIQIKSIRESVDVLKVIPYNITEVNNLDARQVQVEGKIDGMDITYILGFIEGKENMYFVMNWTMTGRIKKYEETFKSIISSFELIKK